MSRSAPGSRWTFLAHYWIDQTHLDPQLTATMRVFVRGVLVSSRSRTFAEAEQLWTSPDVARPSDDGEPVLLIDALGPFARPF